MARLRRLLCRLRNVLRPFDAELELAREVDAHLRLLAEDFERQGLTPRQALVAARRKFGGVEQAKELHRDARSFLWLDQLRQDSHYACRTLARNPGFTVVAVLTLALGIGANTAIFSLIYAVLWRPLPFHAPERLVMVWEDQTRYGFPQGTPAPANFLDWRTQNHVFEDMAAMVWQDFTVTGNGNPERIAGLRVMAGFFPLLGVQPILGRTFVPAEDRPEAAPTAVLSYGFWQRRFGGDRGLVGRTISLNGAVRTVVGIMPAGFQFPSRQAEVWVPAAFTSRELAERDSHYLTVIARLKGGTLLSEAEANMAVIARTLEQQYPVSNKDLAGVRVIPLREQYAGGMRLPLAVLLATVGTVLFVACANVAHLLLARGMFRRKEIAMRVALGAGRGRVLRQLVTECLVLAVTGELLGVALSTTSFLFLARLIPES
ncbi:MAG: hypothetical protein DMF90_21560, partial [Acidobacteria bacterium]